MASAQDPCPTLTRKVEDLQVLRAVAIILVVFQHLSISSYLLPLFFPRAQPPFWIGVELFFVISGYVVTASILNRPLSPAGFLVRRAFRLLPAMVCFLAFSAAVCFLVWLLPTDAWGKERIAGTLHSFITDGIAIIGGVLTIVGQSSRTTNGAMWSLSVEFQFYFSYALLMFVFLKANGVKFRTIVAGMAVGLYLVLLMARLIGPYAGNELPRIIKYLIFFKFDFLLLGVIGAAGLRPLIAARAIKHGPLIAPLLIVVSLVLVAGAEPFQFAYVFAPVLDGIVMPAVGFWVSSSSRPSIKLFQVRAHAHTGFSFGSESSAIQSICFIFRYSRCSGSSSTLPIRRIFIPETVAFCKCSFACRLRLPSLRLYTGMSRCP